MRFICNEGPELFKDGRKIPLGDWECSKTKDGKFRLVQYIGKEIPNKKADGEFTLDELKNAKNGYLYVCLYCYSDGQSDGGFDVNYITLDGKEIAYSELYRGDKRKFHSCWDDMKIVAETYEELPCRFGEITKLEMEERERDFRIENDGIVFSSNHLNPIRYAAIKDEFKKSKAQTENGE